VELEEVENPKIQERWLEVINHDVRVENAEPDDVDEDFVVLFLNEEDALKWGIYPVLCVEPGGKVAEYMVSQPSYYNTFATLLTAANVRTASS